MGRVMSVILFLAATLACCSQASMGPAPPPRSIAPALAPRPPKVTLAPSPLPKGVVAPVPSKVKPAPPPRAVAPSPLKPKPAPPPKALAPAPSKSKPELPPPPKAAPAPAKTKPTLVPSPPEKSYHVAVEGVVYCRTCKQLPGYNKDIQASPIQGAVVKLQCNSTYFPKAPYAVNATTDKNGYYLVFASPKISSKDSCKVYLVSSPLTICKKPSNYNGGVSGSKLRFKRRISIGKSVYNLYTTGMLIFAPTYSNSCPSTSISP